MSLELKHTITHSITAGITEIERARGFLEAATLSEEWIRQMGARALVLEAHHTTHIGVNRPKRGSRSATDRACKGLAWSR